MPALALSATERRQHRADAHHLDPVVMVGNEGLTDAVVKAVDAALAAHGLVKVRVNASDREARETMFGELAGRFRELVTFPPEAVEALPDEQYVRNAVDIVFRAGTRATARTRPGSSS